MTDRPIVDSEIFPRRNRLLSSADFDGVFRRASRSRDAYFTVLYTANGRDYPRLGLAIAKKRIGLATARNRLKRIVRESFRRAKSQLSGTDIVIMARDESKRAGNRALFASLEHHWQVVAGARRLPSNKDQ